MADWDGGLPDLRRLRAFHETARSGSARSASVRLGATQPAVTYLLKQLEKQLGVQLFERSAKGSVATAQGRLLALRSERFFSQLLSAIQEQIPDRTDKACAKIASRLTTAQIRSVIAVWQTPEISEAARQLAISGQWVVRHVRSLERLLSVKLLEVAKGRAFPTAAGRELARNLTLAAQEIWSAIEDFDVDHRSYRRGLRVGALMLSPRTTLTGALNTVLARSPASAVEIVEGSYEELIVQLRNGDIDAIFGALRDPPPHADVCEERFHEDPYVVACRRGHPLTRLNQITTNDLANYDFVFPTAGLRRRILEEFTTAHGIELKAQVHTSWLASIIAMIRSSDRLAILSRWHIDVDGVSDIQRLDRVALRHEPRYVGLTTRRSWSPTLFQRDFVETLRALAPGLTGQSAG